MKARLQMDKILEKIKSFRIYEGTRPLDIYQFNRQQGDELIELIDELLKAQREACLKASYNYYVECRELNKVIDINQLGREILNAKVVE